MQPLLYLQLDLSALKDIQDKFVMAESVIQKYAGDLAVQTHAKVVDLATQGLHSRRERYIAALSFEAVSDNVWVITLDASAMDIEEGLAPNTEMLPKLLAGAKAKTAKDGSKYVVIPFKHNTANINIGSESGKTNDDLKRAIQGELKKRKIPYAKLERDINTGEHRLGLIHDIIVNDRDHPKKTHEGIGQGHGVVGDLRRGHTGVPFLERLRIYQRLGKDKLGRPQMQKGIMTFRTASSKQNAGKYWIHPGSPAKSFMDQAMKWAEDEWSNVIVPQILQGLT